MFVDGILVENSPGATYRGIVYDRSLRLAHDDGLILEIFDDSYPVRPISEHIEVGGRYELLLMATIGTRTRYYPAGPPNGSRPMHWGIVMNTDWRPPGNPQMHFLYFTPRLYHNAGGYFQVETAVGPVLFGPDDIATSGDVPVLAGGYVYWDQLRLELLAIR